MNSNCIWNWINRELINKDKSKQLNNTIQMLNLNNIFHYSFNFFSYYFQVYGMNNVQYNLITSIQFRILNDEWMKEMKDWMIRTQTIKIINRLTITLLFIIVVLNIKKAF